MKTRTLIVLALGAACAVGACDGLLTEPAPATSDVSVSFAVQGVDATALATAFDRVNRVYLRFVRPGGLTRDTVMRVTPRNGEIRARLVLETRERVSALGVVAQLWVGSVPIFEGERVIRVELGTATSVEIPLSVVADRIRADRASLSLSVGDTVRLGAAVLFATGDTIPDATGTWTSNDPNLIFVTPAGLAVGRKLGETLLLVRYKALADTVQARVVAR